MIHSPEGVHAVVFLVLLGKTTIRVGLTLLLTLVAVPGMTSDGNWPSFRGPSASGAVDGQNLPDDWGRGGGQAAAVENRDPRAGPRQPCDLGPSAVRRDGGQQS